MMRLDQNWQRTLRHAWSVRWIALAAVLTGIEVVLPVFGDAMPRNVFAALSFAATVAAMVSRVLVQPGSKL